MAEYLTYEPIPPKAVEIRQPPSLLAKVFDNQITPEIRPLEVLPQVIIPSYANRPESMPLYVQETDKPVVKQTNLAEKFLSALQKTDFGQFYLAFMDYLSLPLQNPEQSWISQTISYFKEQLEISFLAQKVIDGVKDEFVKLGFKAKPLDYFFLAMTVVLRNYVNLGLKLHEPLVIIIEKSTLEVVQKVKERGIELEPIKPKKQPKTEGSGLWKQLSIERSIPLIF